MFTTILRNELDVNRTISAVYKNMGLSVFISMLSSFIVSDSTMLMQMLFTGFTKYIVIFSPLFAIFGISYLLEQNISKSNMTLLLYGFSVLMGISFATIFAIFSLTSIVQAFMGASILFLCLSSYGYFTKNNLDSIGQFMFIGLISIILASIVNIFIGSNTFSMVISILSIIIFAGLTAYDTQQIRELAYSTDDLDKLEVQGALTMYLNFINMFMSLVQLFGDRK